MNRRRYNKRELKMKQNETEKLQQEETQNET